MTGSASFPSASTIFALSSGVGPSGVAMIRLSGPEAGSALRALAGRLPAPRLATLMRLRDASGDELDQALVLLFPEGSSFTGEETVELQVHGSRAVVRAVLAALHALPRLRPAEPGEFARRAFENGRMDLPQVEALAALVEAETERQRRQALRGVSGALGAQARHWRLLLLEAKALVAATIDFSDEDDTAGVEDAIRAPLLDLRESFAAALATAERGRIIADGFRVAIIGRPNVGKSTLLNRLAGSDVAIVTEHAGTTRDVIEVRLEIDGFTVVLQDTAGLRETSDPVEAIGIARARAAAEKADLVLWLDDQESPAASDTLADKPTIRVRTKSDLAHGQPSDDLAISAVTGEGLDSLLKRISLILSGLVQDEPALITHDRQRRAVSRAVEQVEAAVAASLDRVEFLAEHLADAERALDELVGTIGVEEVLGVVFSRFCIGK